MEKEALLHRVDLGDEHYAQIVRDLQDAARNAQFREGTEWVMFFGTTNAICLAWTMASYPEYMWLIFCIEALLIFALRVRNVTRPKPMSFPGNRPQTMIRLLYMLEFCYYANYVGIASSAVVILRPTWFTMEAAKWLFAAGFGVSGSLLGATAAFRNQLLFHDVDNTASVFIHFFPALVLYTLRWNYDRLETAFPNLFLPAPFDDLESWQIFVAAGCFYFTWFVPYTLWMLCAGKRLPQNTRFDTCLKLNPLRNVPHDTVFHFNMRESPFGPKTRQIRGINQEDWNAKCSNHDFGIGDVCVYMVLHACCNILGPLLALILYKDRHVGGIVIFAVLILTIYGGSSRYAKMIHLSNAVVNLRRR